MTALVTVLLLTMVGIAIDGTRLFMAKSRFQRAIDAAALAIGTTYADDDALAAMAVRFVEENYDFWATEVTNVDVVSTANDVFINADLRIEYIFVQLFTDQASTQIAASTDVRRAGGGMMVSLVLDNTGSMWGSLNGTTRIEALRSASIHLTNRIFDDQDVEENLRVSVVPYAAVVNPGDEAPTLIDPNAGDAAPQGSYYHGICAPGFMETNQFCVWDPMYLESDSYSESGEVPIYPTLEYDPSDPAEWKGCVFERPGTNSLSDAPPSDEYWKPFIWPVDVDNRYGLTRGSAYDVWYGGTRYRVRFYEVNGNEIDWEPNYSRNSFHGPNVGCPTPILPLTNNRAEVIDALNAMEAWNRGGTISDIGMAWGLRTLTPGAPFTESSTEVDPLTAEPIWESNRWRRAIVLMTDGDNVVYNAPDHDNSYDSLPYDDDRQPRVNRYEPESSDPYDLTGYGRLGDARFRETIDTGNANTAKTRIEQRLATLCTQVKAQNITVYTIVFSTSANESTRDLYRTCASDPGKYWFAPSASALDEAFFAIAEDLDRLRITR